MALKRTAKSCGPDTPTLVSSWRSNPPMTVAKEPGHRGARRKPLKPLRGECRAFSGVTVVTNARVYYTPRAAAGASGARHSLRPLYREGGKLPAKPGRNAPRECGHMPYPSPRAKWSGNLRERAMVKLNRQVQQCKPSRHAHPVLPSMTAQHLKCCLMKQFNFTFRPRIRGCLCRSFRKVARNPRRKHVEVSEFDIL